MVSDLVYRVYWQEGGRWHEEEFASLTEAEIRKATLKRQGFTARVVGIRTTVDSAWDDAADAYLRMIGG